MTDRPGYTPDKITRHLSLPRRIGYVVAGLGGMSTAVVIGQLWATEPGPLPTRTRLAFAGMIVIGVVWAVFAAWALARRPLFAVDRVIAAWLAVTFSTMMTVGTVAVALARGSTAGVLAGGGVGVVLVVAASTILIRARAYRAVLLARKRDLQGGRA